MHFELRKLYMFVVGSMLKKVHFERLIETKGFLGLLIIEVDHIVLKELIHYMKAIEIKLLVLLIEKELCCLYLILNQQFQQEVWE